MARVGSQSVGLVLALIMGCDQPRHVAESVQTLNNIDDDRASGAQRDMRPRLEWNGSAGPLFPEGPIEALGRRIEVHPTIAHGPVYASIRFLSTGSEERCYGRQEMTSRLTDLLTEFDTIVIWIGKNFVRPVEASEAVLKLARENGKGVVFIYGRSLVFEGQESTWSEVMYWPKLKK